MYPFVCLHMVYYFVYTWYTSMSIHGILLCLYMVYYFVYTWYTTLSIHGVLLCLYMIYFFVYTWYTTLSTHGILLCLHMVYYFVYTWYTTLSTHDMLMSSTIYIVSFSILGFATKFSKKGCDINSLHCMCIRKSSMKVLHLCNFDATRFFLHVLFQTQVVVLNFLFSAWLFQRHCQQ